MDLANLVVRDTFRPKSELRQHTIRSVDDIRRAITEARRYVLDESMSEFLAHLSLVPFSCALERRPDALTSLRVSSRLPHPKMFVEVDGHAFRRGLRASAQKITAIDGHVVPESEDVEVIPHYGLLLEQVDPEEVKVTYFSKFEEHVWTLPFHYRFRTDSRAFPANDRYDIGGGMLSHGISGLMDPRFAVVYDRPLKEFPRHATLQVKGTDNDINFTTHALARELGGLLRYTLAFLATLNDVPTVKSEVRLAKGYFARGNYRKYLDTTTLTLQLPRQATMQTLAKRLIAMARRRWHEVEPHWRINKKPNGWICEPAYRHLWSERDSSGHSFCSECGARRVWIVLPTGRGDPTLGVLRHSEVQVTH